MAKDNIRVFVRARPQSEAEVNNNCKNIIRMKGNVVDIINSPAGHMKSFTYDNAFWSCNTFLPGNQNEHCTQEALYTEIGAPLAQHAFDGYNCALITYGSTGAGKRYSLYGTNKEDGIIARLGQNIFTNVQQSQKLGWEVVVECSFMDIYNEQVRCLLNPDPNGLNESKSLRVVEHPKTGYFVLGLTSLVINSANDLRMLVLDGTKLRTIRDDAMNINASQSHSIFTIHIIQTQGSGPKALTRRSKINLVNVGGCEFADDIDDSRGSVGNSINHSLMTLNRVMLCLAEGKSNVPYRDSVLTSILKDSIGVNSKTSILVCISPADSQYNSTVSALQFGERAKSVSISAVKNESVLSHTAVELENEIADLKKKIQANRPGTKERENAIRDLELSESVSSNLIISTHDRRDRSKHLKQEREQNTNIFYSVLEEQKVGNIDLQNRVKNLEKDNKISDILARINGMNDPSNILKAREEIAALEALEVIKSVKTNKGRGYDDFNQNIESSENHVANGVITMKDDTSRSHKDAEKEDIDLDDLEDFDDSLDDELDIDLDDIDLDDFDLDDVDLDDIDLDDIDLDDIDLGDLEIDADEYENPEIGDTDMDMDIDIELDDDQPANSGEAQQPSQSVVDKKVVENVTAETLALKSGSEVQKSKAKPILINSHEFPNNRYLKEPFRVCKINGSALLTTRKERIWEVDFFANKFRNCDIHGRESFSLLAKNLYRVEKNTTNNTRLTLHFFEAAHPYVLSFSTTERRQRFYELATLLRRNSVMFCPSLASNDDGETTVKVAGTTIERYNGKARKVNGVVKFNVARMPYEVIDLWYGCFSLDKKVLPQSEVILQSFIPKSVHDVYVIGIVNVPIKYMGTNEISNYFLDYLDKNQYFVLSSTAFLRRDRKKDVNNIIIVICRRSFIVRLSNIEASDINCNKKEGTSSGDFSAVGCSLRINETTVAFILLNATTSTVDPSVRAAAIRGLISNFPFGNPYLDIGVRFDNIIISGAFGFGDDFLGNDMLIKQMNVGNIMSDMKEENAPSTITGRVNPMRVFYMFRPRVCRMDVKSYQSSRALDGNNASINIDIFCQRPFLSTFGCKIKRSKFFFQKITIIGQRIPSINCPEMHIIADWIEGAPIRCDLSKNDEMYELTEKGCPGISLCVCAPDFLRLQHVDFSIFGLLNTSKEKKKICIASGSLPLKNVVTLGKSAEFTIPLYYRGCTVGTMVGEVIHVFNETTPIDYEIAEVSDNTPNVHVFACYENQVFKNGQWVPSTIEEGKACEWSGQTELRTEMTREKFKLPNKKKWKWLTLWRTETKDDGWLYGNSIRNAVGKMNKEHKFRRRRWVRAVQADDPIVLHDYLKDL